MDSILQLMEDWGDYRSIGEAPKPENWVQQQAETMELLTNSKRRPAHLQEFMLKEALVSGSFPLLFGDVLDRQVLTRYQKTDPVWRLFSRKSTLKDFKDAYRFAITGGTGRLPLVSEKGEYLASKRSTERYILAVLKYGQQFDISWEAIINDDLNALKDTGARFADAAIATEEYTMTNLYAGDVGTHVGNANLYEVGVNAAADALSVPAVQAGITSMAAVRDENGEPIKNNAVYLVVPPALQIQARQILTSSTLMWLSDADDVSPPQGYPTRNVIKDMRLTMVVDEWLPVCDVTSDEEGWYLFANPSNIAALEGGFLRGHETPEICMKASDKVSLTGAPMSPFSGDFLSDDIMYRVRHVFGGTKLDWRATYMGGYQG